MNGLTKVERDLSPSPPERSENEIHSRQSHHQVAAEEKPVEEKDDETNRNETKNQTWDEREGKEEDLRPKWHSWLRGRKLSTTALGTDASGSRVDM